MVSNVVTISSPHAGIPGGFPIPTFLFAYGLCRSCYEGAELFPPNDFMNAMARADAQSPQGSDGTNWTMFGADCAGDFGETATDMNSGLKVIYHTPCYHHTPLRVAPNDPEPQAYLIDDDPMLTAEVWRCASCPSRPPISAWGNLLTQQPHLIYYMLYALQGAQPTVGPPANEPACPIFGRGRPASVPPFAGTAAAPGKEQRSPDGHWVVSVTPPFGPAGGGMQMSFFEPDGTFNDLLEHVQQEAVQLRRVGASEQQTLFCAPGIDAVQWSSDQRAVLILVASASTASNSNSTYSYRLNLATGAIQQVASSPGAAASAALAEYDPADSSAFQPGNWRLPTRI
jgi:hypothetical protein